MNLDPLLSSLPKEVDPILNKFAGKAVEFRASASHNTANNNAVQVCGPVASSIQYIFNFSLHHYTCEIDTCWRLIGRTSAVEVSTSKRSPLPRTVQKLIKSPPGDPKLQHSQHLAVQAPHIQQLLRLHSPGKGTLPVLATFDPNTKGNWIASRIVKRLEFGWQEADTHKEAPIFRSQSFEKTRIFVDLTCGKQKKKHRCQHRFYVVNHCDAFDILLGAELGP